MKHPMRNAALALAALGIAGLASGAGTWCLGLGSLGPVRAGMTVEQVVRLADFSGMERRHAAEECWYLAYRQGEKGAEFQLMIIGGRVVRIELVRASTLHTLSGARIGSSEAELTRLYGARLDVQPHKYDERGRTITYRSSDGALGMRFETSSGKVTAIQSGPWEHLNYVEGCS
ncbi:MAG: hypothetical protein K0Q92_1504 [Steroidobacteraceae bacterium]|nr:hypothetical protein [Steroidobacteraceae bacterium]